MLTTKNGLLYRDGVQLDVIDADKAAREAGFVFAEQLVTHLKEKEYMKGLARRRAARASGAKERSAIKKQTPSVVNKIIESLQDYADELKAGGET